MLVSHPSCSTAKFRPAIASGLWSLLVPPSGGVVVTRAIAAASRGCGGAGVQKKTRRDGASVDEEKEEAEEEEEVMVRSDADDAGNMQDEEDDGFTVSFGPREPRHRLPPPIPSLRARGVLKRTRTDDGRVVIRVAPIAWPERTRARRCGGRLIMHLVAHDEESPLTLLARPTKAREDVITRALVELDDDTTMPDITGDRVADDTAVPAPAFVGSEGIDEPPTKEEEMLSVAPPPRVSSVGCFEDVFNYSSIGGSPLHRMPNLIKTVH